MRRAVTLTLALTAVLMAGSSCADEEPLATPIRLVDLLEGAAIHSPATELVAASTVDELGEVARETVHEESFGDFDAKAAGWTESERAGIAPTADGPAFRLRELARGDVYRWVVPALPSTYYVFERRVRTEAPLAVDFAVVEVVDAAKVGGRAMRSNSLKTHWPPLPESDGAWQRGSVLFFSTPNTHALVITARHAAHATSMAATDQDAWFDDLRVERVAPSHDQTIALVKARANAPGADAALGMAKYGQFPPLGATEGRHVPEDGNFSYRHAIYAPSPTEIAFPLQIPQDAALYFSVTLSRETARGAAARFEVLARTGEGEESLWSREVAAVEGEWRWQDARIDLSRFADQRVNLVLRTESASGAPHPVWGNPVIDVSPQGSGPRNIILIAVDTLRADRLSCYGYELKTTPVLDALAAEGVRFDQVACNANWTCPSFASIFTGVVPSRHGVLRSAPRDRVPARYHTLAERFRDHGWATHSIAYKAPLYDGGYEQGFDVSFNVPRVYVQGSDNLTEALEWLQANSERRNFLFLHFNDPHQPFTQPEPFDSSHGPDPKEHGIAMPYSLLEDGSPKDRTLQGVMRGLYDGEVAYVDHCIGEFLGALRRRDLYDDAVVVLVSDHGEELWEHGAFGHGGLMLHDSVARVPLIIKPPRGDYARGVVVQSQVRAFDIMPTLLDFAGIPVGDGLDAETLTPMLAPGAPSFEDRLAVIETSRHAIAMRTPGWKYILKHVGDRRPTEELFDLRQDPNEWRDAARNNAKQLRRMRLLTLDYVLRHRPGQYLVALRDGASSGGELSVTGLVAARPLYGIPPVRAGDSVMQFEGESPGPLLFVARVEIEGEPGLVDSEQAVGELARYEAGELLRLVEQGGGGVYLFDGPPLAAPSEGGRRSMDARQLEALRGLGYAGNKREGY